MEAIVSQLEALLQTAVPRGADGITVWVDEVPVHFFHCRGRVVMVSPLHTLKKEDEEATALFHLVAMAAAGRMIQDDATVAWEASSRSLILWAPAVSEHFVEAFEAFLNARAWWLTRVATAIPLAAVGQHA